MNRMDWMTRPVLAGIQSLVLLVLPLGLPLLVPLQMVAPLPILMTALWGGPRAGWIGVAIPVGGAMLLSGGIRFPLTAFVLFFGFPLVAAWLVRGGWKTIQCLGMAFFLGVAVLVLFFLWTLLAGIDFESLLALKLDAFKANVMASIAKNGGDALLLAEVRSSLDLFVRLLSLLLPAFVLSGWFLLHAGNFLAARALARKWGGEALFSSEDLTQWRLPPVMVWVVIGAGLLAYFTQGSLRFLGANLVMFLAILYFFQGMAIVQAGFRRYAVANVARGFFYFALIFWSYLVLLVTVIGLFDIWVDFRKRFFSTCKEGEDSPGS